MNTQNPLSATNRAATRRIRRIHGIPETIFMLGMLGILAVHSIAVAQDGAPEVKKTYENVIYGMHGGLALLMDVYQPAEPNGYALLFINGCGWHSPPGYDGFSLKGFSRTPRRVRPVVDVGFTVFAINHRTAPLFRYPAAIEDAQRAVRFIRHHHKDYGVTSERIAAIGHSSGGHLALMLALRTLPGDESAGDPVEREGAGVDAVASLAGPTDLAAQDWSSWSATVASSFVGEPRPHPDNRFFVFSNAYQEASPITYVDADDPPVLLVHGTEDPTVPVTQARVLKSALEKHGVEVKYFEVDGGGHVAEELLANPDHKPEAPSMELIARWLLDHLDKPSKD